MYFSFLSVVLRQLLAFMELAVVFDQNRWKNVYVLSFVCDCPYSHGYRTIPNTPFFPPLKGCHAGALGLFPWRRLAVGEIQIKYLIKTPIYEKIYFLFEDGFCSDIVGMGRSIL